MLSMLRQVIVDFLFDLQSNELDVILQCNYWMARESNFVCNLNRLATAVNTQAYSAENEAAKTKYITGIIKTAFELFNNHSSSPLLFFSFSPTSSTLFTSARQLFLCLRVVRFHYLLVRIVTKLFTQIFVLQRNETTKYCRAWLLIRLNLRWIQQAKSENTCALIYLTTTCAQNTKS